MNSGCSDGSVTRISAQLQNSLVKQQCVDQGDVPGSIPVLYQCHFEEQQVSQKVINTTSFWMNTKSKRWACFCPCRNVSTTQRVKSSSAAWDPISTAGTAAWWIRALEAFPLCMNATQQGWTSYTWTGTSGRWAGNNGNNGNHGNDGNDGRAFCLWSEIVSWWGF